MQDNKAKRILIIRTDRIGDVLLSTPAIRAVRKNYPQAFIAVMVRPYAKDIVEGNPYLNEVIIYDKYGKHKRLWSNISFISMLRKKQFDLALILHPTNRTNIISFLSGIPERVGYNKKLGFLLTRRLEDRKYEGRRHEIEYTLDVVRAVGINPVRDFASSSSRKGISNGIKTENDNLLMPIKQGSEEYIGSFLHSHGVWEKDRLVALHPGASCPSKVWPAENFAHLGDSLAKLLKAKIIVVCSSKDEEIGNRVIRLMRCNPISACGKTTVSELASLLKRCSLFISNDSGPVHIAVAVKTPVIAIFGRNERGLSPKRWGPIGEHDIVLHKEVGCKFCLAHNCRLNFKCLKAITPEEVIAAAGKILIT